MKEALWRLREQALRIFRETASSKALDREAKLRILNELNESIDKTESQLSSDWGINLTPEKRSPIVLLSVYYSGRNFLLPMLERAFVSKGYYSGDYFFDNYLHFTPKRILTSLHPAGVEKDNIGRSLLHPSAKNLKLIFIYRDLRDLAISIGIAHNVSGKRFKPGTSEEDAIRLTISPDESLVLGGLGDWKGSRVAAEDILFFLKHPSIYVVRFEDLKERTYEEMKKMLLYLGENFTDEELRNIVEAGSFEQATGRPRGIEDRTQVYRRGISGEWKTALSSTNRELLKAEAGELMIKAGMVNDLNW